MVRVVYLHYDMAVNHSLWFKHILFVFKIHMHNEHTNLNERDSEESQGLILIRIPQIIDDVINL